MLPPSDNASGAFDPRGNVSKTQQLTDGLGVENSPGELGSAPESAVMQGLRDRLLRAFFEEALDAMVIADDEGRYVDANPAACTLFGLPRQALLGRCIADFAQPSFDFPAAWATFLQNGQEKGVFRLLRADGSLRDVEYAATAHFVPHRHLSVLRDVTEHKQLEQQVQLLNQAMEQQVLKRTAHLERANEALQAMNQRLQAELKQRNYGREQAFTKVVQAIRSSLKLDTIFTLATVHIAELLQGEVSIVQYLPEQQSWRTLVVQHRGKGYVGSLESDIPDAGNPFAEKLKALQVVKIDDTTSITDPINQALAQAFPGAWLLVPISINGVVWGSLTLARPYQSIPWSTEDVDLARQVADQLGIAIQQANLYQQLQESEARLRQVLEGAIAAIYNFIVFADHRYRYTYFSPGCEAVFGYPPDVLLANPDLLLSRIPEVERTVLLEAAFPAIFAGESYQSEFSFQHGDGSLRWIAATVYSQPEASGDRWNVTVVAVDISDRKATEIALRQQEQEFRTLVENVPDGILRIDRDFRFCYLNPTIERVLNVQAADLLGQRIQDSGLSEPMVQRWQAAIERAFITAQMQRMETKEITPFGEAILYSRMVPEQNSEGDVSSVLVLSRDVTNLRQAQNELLHQVEQERLLNSITQTIRQSLELSQVLTTAVEEVRQLLQADRVLIYRFNPDWSGNMIAESVATPWKAVLGEQIVDPCFTGPLVEAYRQGRVSQISDLHHSDAAPCYVELLSSLQIQASLAVPITNGVGLWGLFCIHHCAAPHPWQSFEIELLQRLADQLAIAIQQSELYGRVQQLNQTLEQQVQERTQDLERALQVERSLKRITDQVRDSLDEDQILEIVVQELGHGLELECCDTGIYSADQKTSTIAHEFTRSLAQAKGTTFEITSAVHPEVYPCLFQGQVVQFSNLASHSLHFTPQQHLTILACPIRDDQKILGDLWLFKQASEIFTELEVRLVEQVANQCAIALRQSRLYQAAQAQVLELERLNQVKDDFLSSASHELRSPMANIKVAIDLLEIQLTRLELLPPDSANPPTTNPTARYFQILKDEGKREIELINDLLDLARLDAETEPFFPIPLNLQTWLPCLLEPFATRTQERQQSLNLAIPADLPMITTDPSHLQRVVGELLNNACKYTPPGESIWVSVEAIAHTLELRVGNSGVEVSQEECDRLFDRFYRLPHHDSRNQDGTGLGLALVKKLVEYIGGTIHIELDVGQIQFVIHLPLRYTVELDD